MNGWWLLVILLLLGGMSLMAYSLRALDVPGAVAAFLLGLLVAVVGGIGWLLLMSVFTVLGVLATAAGRRRKEAKRAAEARGGERGLRNVLANGLAAAFATVTLFFVDEPVAALGFATAVAAVTADTMASELGALASSARRIVPPFERRRPGENGCVSWLGQLSAAGGAVVIAVAAVWLADVPRGLAWVPAVGGWLGCQLDSLLGATLERSDDGQTVDARARPLTKEDVNFIASFVPAVAVLLLAQLA